MIDVCEGRMKVLGLRVTEQTPSPEAPENLRLFILSHFAWLRSLGALLR